jgi:hypothetical protein
MFSFLRGSAKADFASAAARVEQCSPTQTRELYADEFMLVCGSGPGPDPMPSKL